MKITFSVNNQILTRTDSGRVIANSSDYLEVEVGFSTDWQYCDKTIQFRNGDTVYTYVLVNDKITQDKHLVLTVGTWKVSIFGVYGNQRITTNTANVQVSASGYIGVTGPTQDVYEELVTIMNSLHTEAASEAVVRSAVEEFITDNFINLVLGYVYQNVYNKDEVDAMIPTDTSDLTNGAGFVTNAVDDLTNYYLKTDTYSQAEINNIISSVLSSVYRAAGSKACAELLPSLLIEQNVGCVYNMTDSGVTTEYFVEGAGITIHEGDNVAIVVTAPNVYQFDLLTGFVDLSNYYTKSETDTLLAGKVDKVIGKGLSTNDYSDADKAVVSGVTDALSTKADKDALWSDATVLGNPVTIKTQSAQAAKQTILTMEPIQSGSGTPAPDNVRPISGRTQAEIWGCAKNLAKPIRAVGETWSSKGVDYVCNADYSISMNGTYTGTAFGQQQATSVILPPGTYIFNGQNDVDSTNKKATLQLYDTETQTQLVNRDTAADYEFTLTKPTEIQINIGMRVGFASVSQITMSPMIRRVGEDATYEPYVQGDSVTRNYGQTVYGGSDNVETGALIVDIIRVELATLNWSSTTSSGVFYADDDLSEYIGVGRTIIACDSLESVDNVSGLGGARTNPDCSICGYSGSGTHRFYIRWDAKSTSVSDLVSALDGVYACYKLATPQTTTLTPAQVNLIKGINNISTDADGISLTYFADGESLTDADNRITSVLGDLAKVEGATASQNYAAGEYLVFQDKFCKASAAITSGDSLAIGTNLTQTTVGAELVAIIAQL